MAKAQSIDTLSVYRTLRKSDGGDYHLDIVPPIDAKTITYSPHTDSKVNKAIRDSAVKYGLIYTQFESNLNKSEE